MVTKIRACRSCGSRNLKPVLSLGVQANADNFEDKDIIRAPLDLVECEACSLIQLKHTVSRDAIYSHYMFVSGIQEANVRALQDVITGTIGRVKNHKDGDAWLDIGANDGTLLKYVPDSWQRYGFEPARNLCAEANKNQYVYVYQEFFSKENAAFYLTGLDKPKVITACAMFYDLDDPNKFCADIKDVLAPDGVFVVQMNYLLTMLMNNTYENVLHEHLCYYSLKSLASLLARHGLEIFDVELNDVNGGSFRVYVSHTRAYAVKESLHDFLHRERDLLTPRLIENFKEQIAEQAKRLVNLLSTEVRRGKVIYGYGASARGQVILQYCNIGPKLLTAIADRNPDKWGKHTLTGIPICSEQEMRKEKPDYLLILPYHFLESFLQREENLVRNGTKLIVPLPTVRVLFLGD